jgi:hypothetical protein
LIWAAALCSLAVNGCPVDERRLIQRPGLVFLTGGDAGDTGIAAAGGTGGGGSEAGAPEAGQPATGGTAGTGVIVDTGGTGGGDEAGQGGTGTGGFATGGRAMGGSAMGGSATAGAGINGGSAGTGGVAGVSGMNAGSGGSGGHLVGRCPDLDDNFVFDCDETIVKNAAFDKDSSDWGSETSLIVTWQTLDALGHSDSGSLGVEDTYTDDLDSTLMLGATQCIPVDAEATYEFAVQVSVPDGAPGTSAGFQLIVYDHDDCSGSQVDIATSNVVSGSQWKVVQLSHQMPTGSKGVLLRLVTIKPYREAPSNVLFDNVLVHPIVASN